MMLTPELGSLAQVAINRRAWTWQIYFPASLRQVLRNKC